jgi:4-amino-4-deoxy-L-arabinose transferase-like glycosyltransferase
MAVPVIDNKSLISAPTWLGIMWGSLAFWAVTTLVLHVTKAEEAEFLPGLVALAYRMRLGTGILLFLAVSLPWYYEMFTFWRVDDESKIFWFRFIIHDHFARLGSGVHTTTPGGDFTYFILQGGYAMFPWVAIIPGAFAVAMKLKIRGPSTAEGVGLIAVLWFTFSWALIGSSATKFHHYVFPMLPPMAILMGLFIDKLWEEGIDQHAMVLLLGVPLFILVGKDLSATPKNFTDLFVYNYDRPYPTYLTEKVVLGSNNVKQLFGMAMVLAGLVIGLFAMLRARAMMFTAGLAAALSFAVWFNWFHWVDLSHHWTQRDQFWRYFTQRRPNEPIAAFLMNWRGETFYSRNTVKQIKDNPQVGMKSYADQDGREWSLVEHNRLGILKSAVGDKNVTLIDKELNNKFVLVTIE